MEVKVTCLPPNCKIWMDDDKIVMRHTLNITKKAYICLKETDPKNVISYSKGTRGRFMCGTAVHLKSMDKEVVQKAYYYLKNKSMTLHRKGRIAAIEREANKHRAATISMHNKIIGNEKFLNYDARLQK
jgi:hypothetical protein